MPDNIVDSKMWTPALGDWQITDERLVQSGQNDVSRAFQDVKTTCYIASFTLKLLQPAPNEPGEGKFIYSDASQTEDYRIDFIYDIGVCRVSVGGWQTGGLLKLAYEKEYQVKVVVKDNLLSVYVDDLLIVHNHNFGKRSDGIIGFGSWKASVEFSNVVVFPFQQIKCFIIMPFDQKRNFLYEYVIKPALEKHPTFIFEFIRADESLTAGRISEEITDFINNSNILIADITASNPNVFYELGFAHAKTRKAILLIEKVEGEKLNIPFDIQDFRCHTYSFSKGGFDSIREKLGGVLTNLVS